MSTPVIQAQNVHFSYDEKNTLLHDVSFQIFKGEKIGIFGPNGGGKTTLLKLLLGFQLPSFGSITILGKSPKEAKKHLSYVPQAMRCDKEFPISTLQVVLMGLLDQLSLWGKFAKHLKEKALEALKRVGLEALAAQPFGTLSGGQMQRVLIARALVSNPEILFLDEATANIDPKASEEIVSFLLSLTPQITLVLVTHDLQKMIHSFDRLLCVNKQVTSLLPKEVCEHFALGLYHSPLLDSSHVKFP